MAKTSMKIKQQRKPKFSTREYTRCRICGINILLSECKTTCYRVVVFIMP